jgi:hypothetical protein
MSRQARVLVYALTLAGSLLGLAAAGCGDGGGGTGGDDDTASGVTVSGKGIIDLDSYAWSHLADKPGTKTIDCQPMAGSGNAVRVVARVGESDVGESFEIDVRFDADTRDVSAASLTAEENGKTYQGDACTATVKRYELNGSAFSAELDCPSSNGGTGPALSIDAEFDFCQLVAPR